MRQIRTGIAVLLCAAMLFAFVGCRKQDGSATDAAVMTVGDVPVYAATYRYQLTARYNMIEKNGLYDRDTYLSYVVNPSIAYPYPYRDTRTEEGMQGLCEDVLKALAYEAASIYAAKQEGYQLTFEDESYIEQARENAKSALEEAVESFDSVDAFLAENGFTEETFIRMYEISREAAIDFNKLLDAYRKTATFDEQAIEAGYARIVKETFEDRYTDGMYSQYLAYYITGARSFPSLYIPDDAIFLRLFVHTNPTEEQIKAFTAQAHEDFNALYTDAGNEFTAQGTAGDLAVAPRDSLVEGLYDAAKDVPIGEIGSMTREQDGKTVFYLFLRVEGETGRVPIDRYPGVREMIRNQIVGATYTEYLKSLIDDPAITVRNEALRASIRPDDGA